MISPQKTDFVIYTLAYYKFLNLEYKAARKLAESLIKKSPKSNFIFNIFAQIVALTSSLELGDHWEVESRIGKLKRTLNHPSFNFQFPRLWFHCIRECYEAGNISNRVIFEKYLLQITQLRENPNVSRELNIFDAESWTAAKLQGVSPLSLKKRNWNNRSTPQTREEAGREYLKSAF